MTRALRLRRGLAGIIPLVSLVLVPPAGAAPAVGPGQPPPAPAPTAACKLAKRTVCGPARPLALEQAVASYEAALRSSDVRRGLGLPSLRELFGAAGARAQALADGRRARGAASAARGARASAATVFSHVGSVGRVSVAATVAPVLAAGVDQISYADRIKGPYGSQTRSIRFTATAATCPIAARGTSNARSDLGQLLAAEHIVTVQRRSPRDHDRLHARHDRFPGDLGSRLRQQRPRPDQPQAGRLRPDPASQSGARAAHRPPLPRKAA
jgi:hypothetical protein